MHIQEFLKALMVEGPQAKPERMSEAAASKAAACTEVFKLKSGDPGTHFVGHLGIDKIDGRWVEVYYYGHLTNNGKVVDANRTVAKKDLPSDAKLAENSAEFAVQMGIAAAHTAEQYFDRANAKYKLIENTKSAWRGMARYTRLGSLSPGDLRTLQDATRAWYAEHPLLNRNAKRSFIEWCRDRPSMLTALYTEHLPVKSKAVIATDMPEIVAMVLSM